MSRKTKASVKRTPYRYAGRYGWIVIMATDNAEALREADRSRSDRTTPPSVEFLQVFKNDEWVQA